MLEMLRSGDIHPMYLGVFLSILFSLIINVLIAKIKGYRLKPAVLSALIPFVNTHVSIGYILYAIFKSSSQTK